MSDIEGYCEQFGKDNFGRDTPKGFKHLTNVPKMRSAGDISAIKEIEGYYKQFGKDNVITTTPAYDFDGKPWDGIAVHVREDTNA